MGRNKYSQHEIDIIGMLLKKKCSGTRFQQKAIRHQLRVNFEFNISDFGEQGKAFGYDELQAAIEQTDIKAPKCPVYQNVDAKPHTDAAEIKQNLIAQLTSSVRWTALQI